MKIEKLIKGVNRNLCQCKIKDEHLNGMANQIIKGVLGSEQSKDIFGEFFGTSSVYKFTKKLVPQCEVSYNNIGPYITRLQFGTRDIDVSDFILYKIKNLNNILENLNYLGLRTNELVDLSDIENIKFVI